MQFFLLIMAALPLVAVIILLLHHYQLRKSRETAELANPLPPLEETVEDGARHGQVGVVPVLDAQPDAPESWQQEVSSLRENGRYQEALSLCRRQYPKMLALQQTLLTLRARIHEDNDPGEDTLESLYATALLASWLRAGGSASAGEISLQLEQIGGAEKYWQSIGYRQLDLLTWTDRELLVSHWGEPAVHANIEALPDILRQPPAGRD